MKRIVIAALAATAWSATFAAPAQAQIVTGQDPERIRALFASWGHDPTEMRTVDGQPLFEARVDDFNFFVAFNGCTNNRGCGSVVFIVNYDDVINPPFEWLNRQNYHYDLITASRRGDDGRLSLRTGITLGREGMPVSTLRAAFDNWFEDTAAIAQAAIDEGLPNEAESLGD
jgi:hypothetical protein